MSDKESLLQWRYQEIARVTASVTRMRIEAAAVLLIGMWITDKIPVWWSFLVVSPFLIPIVLVLFWPAITYGRLIKPEDVDGDKESLQKKMLESIEQDIRSLRKTLETMKKIRKLSLLRFFEIPERKGGKNDPDNCNLPADAER